MTHEPLSLVVQLDDERRLTIEPWTNVGGRRLISVKPEHVDRSGGWHLSHSGLLLAPTAARALALLLEQIGRSRGRRRTMTPRVSNHVGNLERSARMRAAFDKYALSFWNAERM